MAEVVLVGARTTICPVHRSLCTVQMLGPVPIQRRCIRATSWHLTQPWGFTELVPLTLALGARGHAGIWEAARRGVTGDCASQNAIAGSQPHQTREQRLHCVHVPDQSGLAGYCSCRILMVFSWWPSESVLLAFLRGYLGCSWGVLGVFLGCSWGFLGVFLGCSWGVLGVFLGCSWGVLGVFLGCSWGVTHLLTDPLTHSLLLRAHGLRFEIRNCPPRFCNS